MVKVKMCANCGWFAEVGYEHEDGGGWFVQCQNCGRITDEYYKTPAEAIKEWNKWVDYVHGEKRK